MKITIKIENDEGESVFAFEGLSIDSAVDSLYKFARTQPPVEIDF